MDHVKIMEMCIRGGRFEETTGKRGRSRGVVSTRFSMYIRAGDTLENSYYTTYAYMAKCVDSRLAWSFLPGKKSSEILSHL